MGKVSRSPKNFPEVEEKVYEKDVYDVKKDIDYPEMAVEKALEEKSIVEAAAALTHQQRQFAEYYAFSESSGNAVQCYIQSHPEKIDSMRHLKSWYARASILASQQLKNPKVLKYLNELIKFHVVNNNIVDQHLANVIVQHTDKHAKIKAIQEWNRLQQRIVDKVEVTQKHSNDQFDMSKLTAQERITLVELLEKCYVSKHLNPAQRLESLEVEAEYEVE